MIFKNSIRFRIYALLCLALIITGSVIFIVSGYYSTAHSNSYLTDLDKIIAKNELSSERKLFGLNGIKIAVDKLGRISLINKNGTELISNMVFVTTTADYKTTTGLTNIATTQLSDSVLQLNAGNPSGSNIEITFAATGDNLQINTEVTYNKEVAIFREAFVADNRLPLTEIYLKNAGIVTSNFEEEYWIGNEGFQSSDGKQATIIYHAPEISSIQIKTGNNKLVFNLDYAADHPYAVVPFQSDGGGKWVNLSTSLYKKGMSRQNSFTVQMTDKQVIVPRLMKQPSGFEATYIFTEHADGGDIRRNRASYFGSENITEIDNAVGGFAKHRIPVTKSVFFTDSSDVEGTSVFQNGKPSLFLNFLDQLQHSGYYDICLHSPENLNSSRTAMDEALAYMYDRFKSPTWIDHGFYNGIINREAFSADGFDSTSDFYSVDLWKKYGIRYFWAPVTEMVVTDSHIPTKQKIKKLKIIKAYHDIWKNYISPKDFQSLGFFEACNELLLRRKFDFEENSFQYNKGSALPTPVIWLHPTYTLDFYSWSTHFVSSWTDLVDTTALNRYKLQLNRLVNNQGVFLNHGYYVRTSEGDNIILAKNNKLVINPFFDQLLGYMDLLRSNGKLWLTTVNHFADYQIALNGVIINNKTGNKAEIVNHGASTIKGLSLIVKAKSVVSQDVTISQKRKGEELIVWFDLPVNQKVTLEFK